MEALNLTLEQSQQGFYDLGRLLFAFGAGTALIVSLLGILFMTLVVAPNATQRLTTALRERNVLSFFLGFPVLGAFGIVGAIGTQVHILGAANLVAFGVTLILAYAAAAEDIGRRLYWSCGKEGTRAAHLATGWLVFAFGCLFPVIGQIVILPYVSLSALGSLVVGVISRPKPESTS